MDQVPICDRLDDDASRARAVVSRHALPDFVTGFDVSLGEFDGDPAVWIVFKTVRDIKPDEDELKRQVQERIRLSDAVQSDLLEANHERYPYFRFEPN